MPFEQRFAPRSELVCKETGPGYFVKMFVCVSDVEGHSTLRSAARGDFVIP